MPAASKLPWLGPRLKIGRAARLAWAGVGMVCAAVLTIAAFLTPDPSGLGTHRQLLHLAPCSFVLTSGLPCPTCGMTTSFAWMMNGHPLAALTAQPAGAVLCLATMMLLFFSLWAGCSGNIVALNWARIGPVRLMLAIGLLILGGWAFKIVHGLLTGRLPIN
jgi:hypothetical protein